MPSVFPVSVPGYNQNSGQNNSTDTLAVNQHTSRHQQHQDDIIAIATKVGTGNSTASNNTVLRGNGAGTTNFDSVHGATDISGIIPVSVGGTGTSTSTGTGSTVLSNSPTLSTPILTKPTIADFTNADHDHSGISQGGQLGTSALGNKTITPNLLNTGANTGTVNTSETTTSISYTDLATVGPSVTVTIGVNGLALCVYRSLMQQNAANNVAKLTIAASGASNIVADDTYSIHYQAYANNAVNWMSGAFLITGLAQGATTFKLQYAVEVGNQATFSNRVLSVVPL